MNVTVEDTTDEEDGRMNLVEDDYWGGKEKMWFWEEQQDGGGDNEEAGEREEAGHGPRVGKRRQCIAAERHTHQARDGVKSKDTASCLSLANLTGCQPYKYRKEYILIKSLENESWMVAHLLLWRLVVS